MIKIVADSSTLYSREEAKQNDLDIRPLSVTINNKSYKGKLLHMLITDLCRHEVTERLMDYDEIERRLMEIEEASDDDIYEMKPIRSGTIHIQRQNKKGFLDKLKEILGLN